MTAPKPAGPPPRINPLFAIGAVLAYVLLVGLGFLNAPDRRGDSAFLVGTFVGATAVAVLLWLIVFGIARAMGRARSGAARVQIAFWTTAVLALGQITTFGNVGTRRLRHIAQTAVSDSERAGLVFDSAQIRHRQFGFSLPNPGADFQPDSTMQQRMDSVLRGNSDLAAWVLRSASTGQVIVIEIYKDTAADEAVFRSFAKGVRESSTGQEGVEVLLDTTTWAGGAAEYLFASRTSAGAYLQIRCLPHTGQGIGLIVCVTTGSPDPHGLDSVRAGLAFAEQ